MIFSAGRERAPRSFLSIKIAKNISNYFKKQVQTG